MPKLTEVFGIRREWVEEQPKGGAPRLVDIYSLREADEFEEGDPESIWDKTVHGHHEGPPPLRDQANYLDTQGHSSLHKASWNKFPDNFADYIDAIESAVRPVLGPQWKEILDEVHGFTGAANWFIQQLWETFWTVSEAVGEIAFMWEIVINEHGENLKYYEPLQIKQGIKTIEPKHSWQGIRSQRLTLADIDTDDSDFGRDEFAEGLIREADDDEDDGRGFTPPDDIKFTGDLTFNKFPRSFSEFKALLWIACSKDLGPNFDLRIDQVQGWTGATDWAIRQFWDGNWTLYEAHSELGVIMDVCLNKPEDLTHYPNFKIVKGKNTIGLKYDSLGGLGIANVPAEHLHFFDKFYDENGGRVSRPNSPTWFARIAKLLEEFEDDNYNYLDDPDDPHHPDYDPDAPRPEEEDEEDEDDVFDQMHDHDGEDEEEDPEE